MLGLGLSASAVAINSIKGWSPLLLGGALIEMFDPRRQDLLTRPVGQQVSSIRGIKGVGEFVQATSAARPVWDAKAYGGVRNTVNHSRNQVKNWALAGVTVGDPVEGPDGNLSAFDYSNTPGVNSYIVSNNAPLPLSSVVSRGVIAKHISGNGFYRMVCNTGTTILVSEYNLLTGALNQAPSAGLTALPGVPLGDGWFLFVNIFTTAASGTPQANVVHNFSVNPGPHTVRIWQSDVRVAPSFAMPMIETAGVPAWGFGRPGLVCDGNDDCLEATSVAWLPTGAAAQEIWAAGDNSNPATDSTSRRLYQQGSNLTPQARILLKTLSGGVNRLAAFAGDGATSHSTVVGNVDFTGPHVARGIIRPTGAVVQASMDGGVLFSGGVGQTLSSTTTRARMFADIATVGANCWQGVGGLQAIIDPTHPNWTPENIARLQEYFAAY